MAPAAKPAAQSEQPHGAEPILDFDELAPDRETVRKDGKLYELRRMDDFGIAKQQQLQRDGREFSRLWASDDELTEAEQLRLKMLLDRMFEDVLDAAKGVKAKFTDPQRSQVVLTFTLAPLKQLMAAQAGQTEMETDLEARVSEPTSAS